MDEWESQKNDILQQLHQMTGFEKVRGFLKLF